MLKVAKIENNAIIPVKQNDGYNLYSAYNYIVYPNNTVLCYTNLQIIIPPSYYGKIIPHEHLINNNIKIINNFGINCDFRGNVSMELSNYGLVPIRISTDHSIAKLVCVKYDIPDMELVIY